MDYFVKCNFFCGSDGISHNVLWLPAVGIWLSLIFAKLQILKVQNQTFAKKTNSQLRVTAVSGWFDADCWWLFTIFINFFSVLFFYFLKLISIFLSVCTNMARRFIQFLVNYFLRFFRFCANLAQRFIQFLVNYFLRFFRFCAKLAQRFIPFLVKYFFEFLRVFAQTWLKVSLGFELNWFELKLRISLCFFAFFFVEFILLFSFYSSVFWVNLVFA